MQSEGWDYLWIDSEKSSGASDVAIAYGAGYIESYLTSKVIYNTVLNTGSNFTWDAALEVFLVNNSAWMASQAGSSGASDEYWYHVSLVLAQLLGMYDGYCDTAPASQHFDFRTFLNLQLSGDMDDLSTAIGLQAYGVPLPHPKALHRMTQMAVPNKQVEMTQLKDAARRVVVDHETATLLPVTDGAGHCSAFVKVLSRNSSGGIDDIMIAQTSWSGFEDMLRIYKTLNLQFSRNSTSHFHVPAIVSSFSSYGGSLFSGDDWYTLQPSQLVVLETTIGNSNATLYQLYIKPNTVMDWMRNIVANRLADDAPSWAAIFSRYNSGT